MSLEKKYLKSKPLCKVKFVAPEPLVASANSIFLAGDFNDWNFQQTKLRKHKDGRLATTLDLQTGTEYQYRFVVNGEKWENDYAADKYVPSNVCSAENSVVVV